MKFDEEVEKMLSEAQPPQSTDLPEPNPLDAAETVHDEMEPEELPPEAIPDENQQVDVEAITLEFTRLIQKIVQFTVENGTSVKDELLNIANKYPTTSEECVAILDEITALINANIKPSTDYRGPGV